MRVYRCVHCLRELLIDENGNPEPCPDHPEGPVEIGEGEADGV